MNLTSKTAKVELVLQPSEMLNLDNRKQPLTVSCKNGIVWVTCEGEWRDQVLYPGKRYIPRAKGSIVIQAIGEACIDIEENLN